jgi:hypothetical protein
MEELYPRHIAQPPFSSNIVPLDFFFDWLKSELASQSVTEIDELFQVVEIILSTLITEIIANVFYNWIERSK